MKFTAKRSDLLSILSRAASIAPPKSPSPIIACALLKASASRLSVLATDMMLSFEGACACAAKTPGSIAVSAKDLLEKVKSLPEAVITFAFDGKQVALTAEGSKRKFVLATVSAEDFPKFPEVPNRGPDFVVETLSLAGVINSVHYAADMDSGRSHLHAVYVDWADGKLRAVACCNSRLSRADVPAQVSNKGMALFPLKAAIEMSKVSGEPGENVSVTVEDSLCHLSFEDGSRLSIRLGEAKAYPLFDRIIPKSCTTGVTIDRAAFADAIKAVASSSDDGSVILGWKPEGLSVLAHNASKGAAEDELPVADFNGPTVTTASTAKYLVDALTCCGGEKIIVQMTTALHPIVIVPSNGTGFLGLVMPLTIKAREAAA